MRTPQLRIYRDPEGQTGAATLDREKPEREMVSLRLGEILPLLGEAVLSERTWLDDFADDEISIPNDLYEVVLAYRLCRRPTG